MSDIKRNSLLQFWSIRYLLILISSMIVVGLLTTYFIQVDVKNNQLRGMASMAGDMAAAAEEGRVPDGPALGGWLDQLADRRGLAARSVMLQLDGNGDIVRRFPDELPREALRLADRRDEVTGGEPNMIKLEPDGEYSAYLVAVHPMNDAAGHMLLMMPEEESASRFVYFSTARIVLAITLVLAGWAGVFMLMRRLIKPIRETAAAAKQIVAGNYDVQLTKEYREQEIYELMNSFKEMAERLSRLEALRSQFLAGVTHELRTPVASISGLVQAVKDGVVSGREAEEFLDICLKECGRLEKMVEDLLDFNSFAANTVTVGKEKCKLDAVLREIGQRWQYGQEATDIHVIVEQVESGRDWFVMTDPSRLEQIIVNLLNNARDAMTSRGTISISLQSDLSNYLIRVRDEGGGIPSEEQADIFEPFYRGKLKKTKVRGLGLGLPYSRLIARSLGGELLLQDSSAAGTTFMLQLPAKLI